MSYSESLAARIRAAFSKRSDVEEKRMMGGLTFMVKDKMCVAVVKDELMVRLDPADEDQALKKKCCRIMDFTKRPMKGYVFVGQEGISNDDDLDYWLNLALAYNPKAKSSRK